MVVAGNSLLSLKKASSVVVGVGFLAVTVGPCCYCYCGGSSELARRSIYNGPPKKPKPRVLAEHQKKVDEIGKKLNVHTKEDWYSVSYKDFQNSPGGRSLTDHYGSFIGTLQAVYPDYPWNIFSFQKVPTGFWSKKENQKAFLQYEACKETI